VADQNELDRLYREAQSVLKAKEYDRAVGLLTQILVIDENYKDVSRLLAQTVKLKRRRWYNDVRIWGTVFGAVVIVLLIWIVPKLSLRAMPSAEMVNPTATAISTNAVTPTITPSPMPTPIPLAWKRVSIGQEFERDKIIAFEIDPKDRDVLFASMENAGFYQSIDGGISWRPVQIENVPADIAIKLSVNNDHNQDDDYTVTNIGPDGKERIYQAGGNRHVSEDGGKSWGEFGIMGRPRSAAIAFDAEGSVYAFCDSHLCKYSSNGELISTLGKPDVGAFTIISISSNDPNTIYVAGRGMAVSKDGGLTWSKLNNGLGAILLTLETGEGNPPTLYLQVEKCDNFNFPYIIHSNPVPEPGQPVYISNNGGQAWELVIQTGCYLIKDADGVTFYRIGRAIEFFGPKFDVPNKWIWRSQDGGKSWERVVAPNQASTLTTDLVQGGLVYLYIPGEEYESVFYPPYESISEDYGHKWRKIDPPKDAKPCYGSTLQFIDKYRPMAIDPFDGNHVFVIDNGTLLESHNSCDTTSAFATSPNTSMNSIAFDPNKPDTLYTGTDEGAYISFDSGATWNQINDGLLGATVVYSIVVDKDSNVYAATPYGVFKLENK
jgi:photosystem II stability/assembly factor-like uncharacterized protein